MTRGVNGGKMCIRDRNIRITYVFYPDVETNEQRTLIGFYVNGEESAASKWLAKVNFDIRSQLEFKSEGADLNVKSVRIYNKALTSDEVLNNYICLLYTSRCV